MVIVSLFNDRISVLSSRMVPFLPHSASKHQIVVVGAAGFGNLPTHGVVLLAVCFVPFACKREVENALGSVARGAVTSLLLLSLALLRTLRPLIISVPTILFSFNVSQTRYSKVIPQGIFLWFPTLFACTPSRLLPSHHTLEPISDGCLLNAIRLSHLHFVSLSACLSSSLSVCLSVCVPVWVSAAISAACLFLSRCQLFAFVFLFVCFDASMAPQSRSTLTMGSGRYTVSRRLSRYVCLSVCLGPSWYFCYLPLSL